VPGKRIAKFTAKNTTAVARNIFPLPVRSPINLACQRGFTVVNPNQRRSQLGKVHAVTI
jgi:hypothetical protein